MIPGEPCPCGKKVVDPDGEGPRILFERWDGGKPNKRVHIDVNAITYREPDAEERENRLAEERERLEGLGATFHRMAGGMAGERWMEMFDVERKWFCVQ